jgi:hypothetical protein
MIVINTMPCSICKKSGHNRVTCVDARRIPAAPTCSEGEALFALREDATSPYSVEKETPFPRERDVFVEHKQSVPAEEYDAREKSDPQEMKRKPEESAPEERSPEERSPEERSPEESASQERGVGKRSVPTERGVDVTSSLSERGVGKRSVPTEVQAHGFSWEKDLMRMIYHMTEEEIKSIPYTSKVDIPAAFNRLDHCDVSIKASCNPHMICMADGLRFCDSVRSGTPIHMIVVHYCQLGDIKKIVTITEVDLTDSCEALFGSLTRADIETLDRAVKAVPQKKKPTEEERKTMYDIRDSLQKQSGAIHLDIKCNSTQSRLQCSFNRFQQFLESHPTRIVAKSNTHEFRGGALSPEIVSSRRVFKKTLAPQSC